MRERLRRFNSPTLLRLKVRVANVLTSSFFARLIVRQRTHFVVSGLRIDTDGPAVTDSVRASILLGLYEGAEVRLIRRNPLPGGTIVDLGSSLGFLAAAAAKNASRGTRVVCVEANPTLIPLLKRNLEVNAPHCRTEIIHGAIDYSDATSRYVHFNTTGDHTTSAVTRSGEITFSAPRIRLRELLGDDEAFSLIMDIEGAEYGVLSEERETLIRCQQVVAELHESGHGDNRRSVEDLIELAAGAGLRVVDRYGPVVVMQQ